MKSLLSTLILGFALLACTAQNEGTITNINAKEYVDLNANADGILLDVRAPEETNQGVIEGAKIINFYDADFQSQTKQLDKDKPIYVYCHIGGRSAKACKILKDQGFKKVYNIDGGIVGWKEAGYELVK